jgi:hypothetical protein
MYPDAPKVEPRDEGRCDVSSEGGVHSDARRAGVLVDRLRFIGCSAITYDGSSSLSTQSRWTLTKPDGKKVAVQIDPKVDDSAVFTLKNKDGAVLGASRSDVALGYATNDGMDSPDHLKDSYRLLLALPATETADGDELIRVDASAATSVSLTVADLQSLEQGSPATAGGELAARFIRAGDATALLALDPFAANDSINPGRFLPARPAQISLVGPDRAGDLLLSSSTRIAVAPSMAEVPPTSAPLFQLTMSVIDAENTTLEIAYVVPGLATTGQNRGATLTLGTDSLCTQGTVSP